MTEENKESTGAGTGGGGTGGEGYDYRKLHSYPLVMMSSEGVR